MVPPRFGFGHTISVPKDVNHVRSTSLPNRAHPIVSHLHDEINFLHRWLAEDSSSLPRLREGVCHIEVLQIAINDLLQISNLRLHRYCVDALLDDFLRLIDVYSSFRDTLMSLKQLILVAQATSRRKEGCGFSSHVKSFKKIEKDTIKLALLLRDTCKSRNFEVKHDMELKDLLEEVKFVTNCASNAILMGLESVLSSSLTSTTSPLGWSTLRKKLGSPTSSRRRREEEEEMMMESLKDLEELVVEMEKGTGRIFRCFLNTRVSLLNILTAN